MVIEVEEHLQPVFLVPASTQAHPARCSSPDPSLPQLLLCPGCELHLDALVLFQDPGADRRKGVQGHRPSTPWAALGAVQGTQPEALESGSHLRPFPFRPPAQVASSPFHPPLTVVACPAHPAPGVNEDLHHAVQSRTTQEQLKAAPLCFSFSTE